MTLLDLLHTIARLKKELALERQVSNERYDRLVALDSAFRAYRIAHPPLRR